MKQKITGFHQDNESHWVAELECGHNQHTRHDPPWMERPWVLSTEGRASRVGTELNCVRCDETGRRVAEAVRQALLQTALQAYEEGGLCGLCQEGRWELVVDRLKAADTNEIVAKALKP